jgi:hypothetical protein
MHFLFVPSVCNEAATETAKAQALDLSLSTLLLHIYQLVIDAILPTSVCAEQSHILCRYSSSLYTHATKMKSTLLPPYTCYSPLYTLQCACSGSDRML